MVLGRPNRVGAKRLRVLNDLQRAGGVLGPRPLPLDRVAQINEDAKLEFGLVHYCPPGLKSAKPEWVPKTRRW